MFAIQRNNFYNVKDLENLIKVNAYTIRYYLRQGILKGTKSFGKWYVLGMDLYNFMKGVEIENEN